MKKSSELKVPLETGADTTALVYPAADGPAAALILGARRRRRPAQHVHDRARPCAVLARHRRHHLQFPVHRAAAAASRIGARARSVLSRGDRRRAPGDRERAAVAVHRRQIDGRTHCDAGRGSRSAICRLPVSCCSDTRCIRPAGRATARQAPAGGWAPDAVRAGQPRRLRHAGRTLADRRGRSRGSVGTTLHVVEGGRSLVQGVARGCDAAGRAEADVYRTVAAWVSSMTSPSREKPWRRYSVTLRGEGHSTTRSTPLAAVHASSRLEQSRSDAAAFGRLDVKIRQIRVALSARRPDWESCGAC